MGRISEMAEQVQRIHRENPQRHEYLSETAAQRQEQQGVAIITLAFAALLCGFVDMFESQLRHGAGLLRNAEGIREHGFWDKPGSEHDLWIKAQIAKTYQK
jgi:hypothetical protein